MPLCRCILKFKAAQHVQRLEGSEKGEYLKGLMKKVKGSMWAVAQVILVLLVPNRERCHILQHVINATRHLT